MSREFVTELVSQELEVLLVGTESTLRSVLEVSISVQVGNEVRVSTLTPAGVTNAQLHSKLHSAYKIIWLINQPHLSADDQQLIRLCKQWSDKVILVFPIISPISNQTTEWYQWWQHSQVQQQTILSINYHLSDALFVFGRDVVSHNLQANPLHFLTDSVPDRKIIDPTTTFFLIGEQDFAQEVGKYVFRPSPQPSLVIQGSEVSSSTIVQQCKQKYESYHGVVVQTSVASVTVQDPIPFSVESILVETDTVRLLTDWIQSLPSPRHVSTGQSYTKPSVSPTTVIAIPNDATASPIVKEQILPTATTQTLDQPQRPKSAIEIFKERKSNNDSKSTILDKPISSQTQSMRSSVDVNDELQKIFQSSRTEQKVTRVQHMAKTERTVQKKSKRKTALFFGGLLFTGVGLGCLFLIGLFLFSSWWVQNSLVAVAQAVVATPDEVEEKMESLQTATNVLSIQAESYGVFLDIEALNQSESLVQVSEDLQRTWSLSKQIQQTSQQLALNVLGNGTAETSELTESLTHLSEQAYEHISLAQAGLDQLSLTIEDEETLALLEEYQSQLQEKRKALVIIQQLQSLLPLVTGQTEKKTFAVLLQNSQELRPTGGFIQAVALLTFDRGVLINTQVISSYQIDSQLPGSVSAPEEVTRFLGEEQWYLRDSNWSPHFPDTAKWSAWFIEKSLGTHIDGVIAVNFFTLEDIIKAIGPVDLPEYNEVLTHRNLQERMEFHSEEILVDNGQKEYGAVVLEAILKKVSGIPAEKTTPLLSNLYAGLAEHQILFSLLDDSTTILDNLGWAGALVSPECPTQLSQYDCQVSTMAQVEANTGINKANYYIERRIDHAIDITQDQAIHTRTILLENTAPSAAWPKGPYQVYTRFYIEPEAQLDVVTIDGNTVPASEIIQREEQGKKVVGVPLTVGIKDQKELVVSYRTPLLYTESKTSSFAFFNQQQPGTSQVPLTVQIQLSDEYSPTLIAPQAKVEGNTITFSSQDDGHSFFGFSAERK